MQPQQPDTAAAGPSSVEADPAALWSTIDGLLDGMLRLLPLLVVGALVFGLFWVAARVVRAGVERASAGRRRQNVGLVLGRLAYFGLLVLGLLVAVTVVFPSMTPGRLVTTLGIGGVAIGFAFKDILQNLLAGILLLLREPFRVGDEITVHAYTGVVEGIETRATYIKTYEGQRVIIPNAIVYTDPVTVISAFDSLRSEYDVGIGYGDDVAEAKRLILEVLRGTDGVLDQPSPDVLVWDLAGSAVSLRARWWSRPGRADVVHVRDRVLEGVKGRLTEAGIDLPFPTTQVLFHDQTEEADGDRRRQREGWPAGASPPGPRRKGAAVGGPA